MKASTIRSQSFASFQPLAAVDLFYTTIYANHGNNCVLSEPSHNPSSI